MSGGIEDLRRAARLALDGIGAAGEPGADVTRVVMDVTIGGRTEMVTIALRGGEISWSSTDGDRTGPFALEALRLLAGTSTELPRGVRTSPGDVMAERTSLTPGETRVPETGAVPSRKPALADALDDLVTAICRAGVNTAHHSPSVREAIERAVAALGSPLPLGAARWLALLKATLGEKSARGTARMLHGASLLADDLRRDVVDDAGKRRLAAWLGSPEGDAPRSRLTDRPLLEVARERVSAVERGTIERRYLVCLETGEAFREEVAGGVGGSAGPSPRLVNVGLGEVADGPAPRALRLLQYSVVSSISAADVQRVGDMAQRSFEEVAKSFRESSAKAPGLVEPFVVVAPAAVELDPGPCLRDASGTALPLATADDGGRTAALLSFLAGATPKWVAGRLEAASKTILLVPCSVALDTPEGHVLRRI